MTQKVVHHGSPAEESDVASLRPQSPYSAIRPQSEALYRSKEQIHADAEHSNA
jgi:hypothetical protein